MLRNCIYTCDCLLNFGVTITNSDWRLNFNYNAYALNCITKSFISADSRSKEKQLQSDNLVS